MKNLAVIQARLGSTRLPGKVMLPLAGEPLLVRMVERVAAAKTPFDIIVATTTNAEDDAVYDLCLRKSISCYRGHPTDLLDRHYQAALAKRADVIAKIPSDCPLIDPAVIDKVFTFYEKRSGEYDFVSNLHPATYPDGNDVEIMPFSVLETAWKEAVKPFQREHTTPFVWDQPSRFRVGNVAWETGMDCSMTMRWTIDYPEDYQFIKKVYEHLWSPELIFSLEDILSLMRKYPELGKINSRYAGVNWYRNHLNDLKTIDDDQTRTPAEIQS